MKVVFFGMNTSFSAVHFLALRTEHNVAAVFITKTPLGFKERFKQWIFRLTGYTSTGAFSIVKSCAVYNVPVYFQDSVNDEASLGELRRIQPDIICMAGFSEKLSALLLKIPQYGVLNLHTSILPDYRGANPFFWMVRKDKVHAGCSVHRVDEHFDTGTILETTAFDIFPGVNLHIYNTLASIEGSKLLLKVLRNIGSYPADENRKEGNSLNCRSPRKKDLVITKDMTIRQALWLFNAFSDVYLFTVEISGILKPVRKISSGIFENSIAFQLSDGVIYLKVEK